MRKNYNQAPLPFQGQKRRFQKQFKECLKGFSKECFYVDLFGGSGLLSHFAHTVHPKARVIYNDFDNYSERLANVGKTNVLLERLREILNKYPDAKSIQEPLRSQIIELLSTENEKGFVDYITLSSSLLFSMNYATDLSTFIKQPFYNNIRQSPYTCSGYLDGLEIVQMDYKVLFDKYRHHPNAVFFIDPPYLSTNVDTYTSSYWKLADYLDVLHTLKNTNYFYFTSNKSSIVELTDWLARNYHTANPFQGATRVAVGNQLTHNARYTDIMYIKKRTENE